MYYFWKKKKNEISLHQCPYFILSLILFELSKLSIYIFFFTIRIQNLAKIFLGRGSYISRFYCLIGTNKTKLTQNTNAFIPMLLFNINGRDRFSVKNVQNDDNQFVCTHYCDEWMWKKIIIHDYGIFTADVTIMWTHGYSIVFDMIGWFRASTWWQAIIRHQRGGRKEGGVVMAATCRCW